MSPSPKCSSDPEQVWHKTSNGATLRANLAASGQAGATEGGRHLTGAHGIESYYRLVSYMAIISSNTLQKEPSEVPRSECLLVSRASAAGSWAVRQWCGSCLPGIAADWKGYWWQSGATYSTVRPGHPTAVLGCILVQNVEHVATTKTSGSAGARKALERGRGCR